MHFGAIVLGTMGCLMAPILVACGEPAEMDPTTSPVRVVNAIPTATIAPSSTATSVPSSATPAPPTATLASPTTIALPIPTPITPTPTAVPPATTVLPTAIPAAPTATPRAGFLLPPYADDLIVPTISESELESSYRHLYLVEPSITLEGSSIIYVGGMHPEGYDRLSRLARQGSVSELVISSPGGIVYWGIRTGEIVYRNGWDVRVRGLCLSSCANYVFPAGRNKIIEDGAIVGWHGSPQQHYFAALRKGVSVRQELINFISVTLQMGFEQFTQEEFNREIANFVAENELLVELESAFYERIGVDPDVSVYGHFPQRWEDIQGSGGWTFTLDDMAKFGLDGISYEGSDAYPPDQSRVLFSLVLFEVFDR